ncbi:MAG: S8 family serine peptidase [Myxococcota bacterium]
MATPLGFLPDTVPLAQRLLTTPPEFLARLGAFSEGEPTRIHRVLHRAGPISEHDIVALAMAPEWLPNSQVLQDPTIRERVLATRESAFQEQIARMLPFGKDRDTATRLAFRLREFDEDAARAATAFAAGLGLAPDQIPHGLLMIFQNDQLQRRLEVPELYAALLQLEDAHLLSGLSTGSPSAIAGALVFARDHDGLSFDTSAVLTGADGFVAALESQGYRRFHLDGPLEEAQRRAASFAERLEVGFELPVDVVRVFADNRVAAALEDEAFYAAQSLLTELGLIRPPNSMESLFDLLVIARDGSLRFDDTADTPTRTRGYIQALGGAYEGVRDGDVLVAYAATAPTVYDVQAIQTTIDQLQERDETVSTGDLPLLAALANGSIQAPEREQLEAKLLSRLSERETALRFDTQLRHERDAPFDALTWTSPHGPLNDDVYVLAAMPELDLIRVELLLDALENESFRRELVQGALTDLNDLGTEHGGSLDLREDGLRLRVLPPLRARSNHSYARPGAGGAGPAGITRFHFHAATRDNSWAAGPSLPDFGGVEPPDSTSETRGQPGVAFSLLPPREGSDRWRINTDFYFYSNGELLSLDLGVIEQPLAIDATQECFSPTSPPGIGGGVAEPESHSDPSEPLPGRVLRPGELHGLEALQETDDEYLGDGVLFVVGDGEIDDTHSDLPAVALRHHTREGFRAPNDVDHATYVAGIVLGQGDGTRGVRGLAPRATLGNVVVMVDEGHSPEDIINGIDQVIEWANQPEWQHRPVVLNLSLGERYLGDPENDPVIQKANEAVREHGIAITAAIGNEGYAPGILGSPAMGHAVFGVGIADHNDTLSPYDDRVDCWSSYGDPHGEPRERGGPDFIAAGVGIPSTNSSGGYTSWNIGASSASSPVGGGVIAAVLGKLYAMQERGELHKPVRDLVRDMDLHRAVYDSAYDLPNVPPERDGHGDLRADVMANLLILRFASQ